MPPKKRPGKPANARDAPALPCDGAAEGIPSLEIQSMFYARRPKILRRVKVCTYATCAGRGSQGLLADIEELGALCGIVGEARACMDMCAEGPNCQVELESLEEDATESGLDGFDAMLGVLSKSLGHEPKLPKEFLEHMRFKSDSRRILFKDHSSRSAEEVVEDMKNAEEWLSKAIHVLDNGDHSLDQSLLPSNHSRDLHLLRGKARSRMALMDKELRGFHVQRALEDFEAVVALCPLFAPVYLEKSSLLSIAGQVSEAIRFARQALKLSSSTDTPSTFRLDLEEHPRIEKKIEMMGRRLNNAVDRGLGGETQEWTGSGLWRVASIEGVSWDTCVYHLESPKPCEPHPLPKHAWHVRCGFGKDSREYTPLSTAEEWEDGKLDILVKTYEDGIVSSKFAKLKTYDFALQEAQAKGTSVEDEDCWVWCSLPHVTLYLPSCQLVQPVNGNAKSASRVGMVIGGTGVAPAVQLMREIANSHGAFGAVAQAVLVFSSRTIIDVLCLNELRSIERSSDGRVKIWHTLTKHPPRKVDPDDEDDDFDPWDNAPMLDVSDNHGEFASYYRPYEPDDGYVGTADGEAEPYEGRISEAMLKEVLPAPGSDVKIVTCGPPDMQEAVKRIVCKLGHAPSNLAELSGHKRS